MVLFIKPSNQSRDEWVKVEDEITLKTVYDNYEKEAGNFSSQKVQTVDAHGLLYVFQREMALVQRNAQGSLSVVGTEDATTCLMVVLRNDDYILLTHLDGAETRNHVRKIVEKLQSFTKQSRLKLYLVGGFTDNRLTSESVCRDTLTYFHNYKNVEIELHSACICSLNNETRHGLNWPKVTGIGVDISTGTIFPATFSDHGPCDILRGVRTFTDNSELMDIYDATSGKFAINPFNYIVPYAEYYVQLSDREIRNNLSTSPHAEAANFESIVRKNMQFVVENPNADEYFAKTCTRYTMDNETKLWHVCT